MVELKRKKGESFETFLRRFSKKLQTSGKLYDVREKQRHQAKPTKRKLKLRALVGKKIHSRREYLKKIGKYREGDKSQNLKK